MEQTKGVKLLIDTNFATQREHQYAVGYDALNRPILSAQSELNGVNFATSHYDYGKRGILKDVYRDEEGKGDYFTSYDDINQLAAALYSATGPSDSNPAKSVSC